MGMKIVPNTQNVGGPPECGENKHGGHAVNESRYERDDAHVDPSDLYVAIGIISAVISGLRPACSPAWDVRFFCRFNRLGRDRTRFPGAAPAATGPHPCFAIGWRPENDLQILVNHGDRLQIEGIDPRIEDILNMGYAVACRRHRFATKVLLTAQDVGAMRGRTSVILNRMAATIALADLSPATLRIFSRNESSSSP